MSSAAIISANPSVNTTSTSAAAAKRPGDLMEGQRAKVVRGMAHKSRQMDRKPDVRRLAANRFDERRDVYLPEFFSRAGGTFYSHDVVDDTWWEHLAWG